jgi:hypothetical protein
MRTLLHLLEHLIEVEAGSLLALWIFSEGLQEFPDERLCWYQQVDVVDHPIPVGRLFLVIGLLGVAALVLWAAAK